MARETRRYRVAVDCASCMGSIEMVLRGYPDITWNLNIVKQVLRVELDPELYNDEFIVGLIKKAGYDAKRL